MLDSGQLLRLIEKIYRSEYTDSQLNLYIRYCAALSTAYLFSRRKTGKLADEYLTANEPRMQQLALDSIAELFARDEKDRLYKLVQYYEPLMESIRANSEEALFMTRRLVVAHTKQSLVKTFIQNDPSGARIYRNLSLVHKRNSAIKLVVYGDENYLYWQEKNQKILFPDDLNPEKPEIDWDAAMGLLKNAGQELETLPGVTRYFLQMLKRESAYRHFISRRQLYQYLKQIMGLKLQTLESDYPASLSENLDITSISKTEQQVYADRIKAYFRSEIQSRFIEKAKLDQEFATAYTVILDQYFTDLLMDGFSGKLPDYKAKSVFKDMKADKWKIHRGRLEYLIKLCKTELQNRYRSEFLNNVRMPIGDN